jgi:hypothetical protein
MEMKKLLAFALVAGLVMPLWAQEDTTEPVEDTTVPVMEDPAASETAPVAVPEDRETGEDFEKRVRREVKEMDKQINQLKKRAGDFTAEQKGALTVYKERRKVVDERLDTVDSADSAQVGSAKQSVNDSLIQLQNAYNDLVDLFERR